MEKKLNQNNNFLSHIFPFLNNNEKNSDFSKSEYKSIVSKIQEKNTESNDFLTGEEKIIDSLILKYSSLKKEEINNNLEKLTLKIPENFSMLNDIGFYLKNLKYLNLEGSFLCDLNGIVCFVNLKEFDASFNKIEDLFELEMCNNINVLKLNDNKIEKEENFEILINLINLKELNIKNNSFVKYLKNWKFNNEIKIEY